MDVILEKSLANVHCMGVDSIVIKDAPNMVRIFIARPEHELWRNDPYSHYLTTFRQKGEGFSVGLHKHHCDVTLLPLMGEVYNVRMLAGASNPIVRMFPYRYKSPITGGHGSFEALDTTAMALTLASTRIMHPLYLRASEPHSIYVAKGKAAVWMVWEGDEDPNYMPTVWTNDILENFSFEGYNQPITEQRLYEDLSLIGVKSWRP